MGSTLRSKSVTTWRLASVSSRSGTRSTTKKALLRNRTRALLGADLLAGLQEIETQKLEKGIRGTQNPRIASQSQETGGLGRGIEDQDRNTGNRAQGTEGQGQETGSQGQKTADQGLRTENQDIGQGQGTSPGTEETGLGQEKRRRKRKGTDPAPETGITRNTRRRGHVRGEDQHHDPGPEKASKRVKMTTTVRN